MCELNLEMGCGQWSTGYANTHMKFGDRQAEWHGWRIQLLLARTTYMHKQLILGQLGLAAAWQVGHTRHSTVVCEAQGGLQ